MLFERGIGSGDERIKEFCAKLMSKVPAWVWISFSSFEAFKESNEDNARISSCFIS